MSIDYQVPMAYATVVGDGVSNLNSNSSHHHIRPPRNVEPLPSAPITVNPSDFINEGGAREFLSVQKWPVGLQDTFVNNLSTIAFRFFICDDSGSMVTADGHNLVGGPLEINKRLVPSSRWTELTTARWTELTTALKFHAQLANATASATQFRMLNQGSPVTLGTGTKADGPMLAKLTQLLNGSPGGGTPLCHHINQVVKEIRAMESELRTSGQKALVVIATDGEASDGNVAQALRPLKNLPVWVMVRLCTDDEKIVDYWNDIDKELELSMDVLDDLCGEAKEIYKLNKWLTYGEPLQRLREFGLSVKELDLLDERKLSMEELTKVCAYIFGGSPDRFPHPQVNWNAFIAAIAAENAKIPAVWNPVTKTVRPWIDTAALTAKYQKSTACTIC